MSFKKTKRTDCPFRSLSEQCRGRNDLNWQNLEEHLMQDPHSFTKEKAKNMANLVREKLSSEDPPSKKGKPFNIENLINVSSQNSSNSPPIITSGASSNSSPIITYGASSKQSHATSEFEKEKEKVKSTGIKKLFVSNIREGTLTEHDLHRYFIKYGKIIDIQIVITNGIWRGFGFVEFDQCAPVDNIVRQGDHVINGYKVHVEPALPKPQSTRRSEGGARCSNYLDEGDFGISPAEYHNHGSGAFNPPAGSRSDSGQIYRSSQADRPMRRQNNFGDGFGGSGTNSRHHVGQGGGFHSRK